MKKDYLRWSKTPYAGESKLPTNPVTALAGSWSLYYFKRNKKGKIVDPNGKKMKLPITHPKLIDFDQELTVVQNTLENLTPEQKNIGVYYGTGVPTKQWTPVIDRLIDTYGLSPTYAARLLAAIQAAINDTMIIVWELKYRWDVARPNQYDQSMKTVLCTPRFPAYPSGHATMSGCTEVLLSYLFPKETEKLKKIAEDNAVGRLFTGVHFPSDNDEGLQLGRYIGNLIVNHLKTQQDGELRPIDQPYTDFLDANIFPDNFRQFIPYDFPATCTSLVQGDVKCINNVSNESKPLLYLNRLIEYQIKGPWKIRRCNTTE